MTSTSGAIGKSGAGISGSTGLGSVTVVSLLLGVADDSSEDSEGAGVSSSVFSSTEESVDLDLNFSRRLAFQVAKRVFNATCPAFT